jgi:hypothetical protein
MKKQRPVINSRNLVAGWQNIRSLFLVICLFMAGFRLSTQAQTSLNVTDFGALGDAQIVYVSTVSNSVAVTFTNTLSAADIGKTVELFDVGQPVIGPDVTNPASSSWIPFSNLTNQSLMRVTGTITNITQGTNLYVQVAMAWTTAQPAYNSNLDVGQLAIVVDPTNAPTLYVTTSAVGTNLIGNGIDIYINPYFYYPAETYGYTYGGAYAYEYAFPVHHQSVVATITNVAGNVAYLAGDLPGYTTNSAYCIYGTDNASNFQAAVNSVNNTNTTINVPAGTFLMLPGEQYTNNVLNPSGVTYAMFIHGGGFSLVGTPGQTVLMAAGAWKQKAGWFQYGYARGTPISVWNCNRGTIFNCVGPITNNYPIAFRSLIFDGGMPLAYKGYEGIYPANAFDGLGWDGSSAAGLDSGSGALNIVKTFDTCGFRHFQSEMIKGITGTDGQGADTEVTNCWFTDGNATVFNYNTSHTITGCTFSNMYQVEEFYLYYSNTRQSAFINNWVTNVAHNVVSLNGGSLTNQPYVISNNVIYCTISGNAIATCPAANVTIASNTMIGMPGYLTSAIVIGQNGGQPGTSDAINTNYNIFGNTFSGTPFYYCIYAPALTSTDQERISGMNIYWNKVTSAQPGTDWLLWLGWTRNVNIFSNDWGNQSYQVQFNNTSGSQLPIINATNNYYWFNWPMDGGRGNFPFDTYTAGSRFKLVNNYLPASVTNFLTTQDITGLPSGTALIVSNAVDNALPVPVFLNEYLTNYVTIPSSGSQLFYWNGAQWATNLVVLTVGLGTGSSTYASGSVLTVTANSISGKRFAYWSGATNILLNPFAATTIATVPIVNTSITANYAPISPPPVPTGLHFR